VRLGEDGRDRHAAGVVSAPTPRAQDRDARHLGQPGAVFDSRTWCRILQCCVTNGLARVMAVTYI
jgi:hypothetical protein